MAIYDINGNVLTQEIETFYESIDIEYGRLKSETSYYFVRIPKYTISGKKVVPHVALTSSDGSTTGSKVSAYTYAIRNKYPFVINASLFNTTTKCAQGQLVIDGTDMTTYKTDSSGNKYAWMDSDMGSAIGDSECYPLLIDANGDMSCLSMDRKADQNQPDAIISAGYKQAITAWGMIVNDYKDNSLAASEIVHQGKFIRQVIGQFQNGDYFVASFDGTGKSGATAPKKNEAGANYSDLAEFFIAKGARIAYSLDGGGSTETILGSRFVNPIFQGTTGRVIPTVIYFDTED